MMTVPLGYVKEKTWTRAERTGRKIRFLIKDGQKTLATSREFIINQTGSSRTQHSYCMTYQWCRKDPFPSPYFYRNAGASMSYAEQKNIFLPNGSTYSFSRLPQSIGGNYVRNYVHTVANPTKYMPDNYHLSGYAVATGRGIHNVYWSGMSDDWGKNTLSNEVAVPTVYDPSPYGWAVPSLRALKTLFKLSDGAQSGTALQLWSALVSGEHQSSTTKNHELLIKAPSGATIRIPVSGIRQSSGSVGTMGTIGFWTFLAQNWGSSNPYSFMINLGPGNVNAGAEFSIPTSGNAIQAQVNNHPATNCLMILPIMYTK